VGLIAGRDVMEKSVLLMPGIKPRLLGLPVRSLVAIPTELSQLQILIEINNKALYQSNRPCLFFSMAWYSFFFSFVILIPHAEYLAWKH
jgi:hypothetical protein